MTLIKVITLSILIAFSIFSCSAKNVQSPKRPLPVPAPSPVNSKPLSYLFITEECSVLQNNVAFIAVGGGSLKKTIIVPSWLTYKKPDENCFLKHKIQLVQLDKNSIYISQDNWDSENGIQCRILNVSNGTFSKPRRCIYGPTGGNFTIQRIRRDFYFLFGYQEGPGQGQIIKWSANQGKERVYLEHITSPTPIKRLNNVFIIESNCNPLNGTVPKKTWSDTECNQGGKITCGHCAATFGKTYKWRWKPGETPVLLK